MKYVVRVLLYAAIFFVAFTVVSVGLIRFVPVAFTPLKVIALRENAGQDAPVRSRWVPIGRISDEMVTAVVATEDNNFMKHHGVVFQAIKEAVQENREGRRLRGASTISQQTAKNVFCLPDRTWLRKGIETWFTAWIELLWSKRRIMEVYLNVVETHRNMYGVGAAARRFYQKSAANLNRYEAAMIATVLPSPRRMNIGAPSAYMTRRAAQVRRLMSQVGTVDLEHRVKDEVKNKK